MTENHPTKTPPSCHAVGAKIVHKYTSDHRLEKIAWSLMPKDDPPVVHMRFTPGCMDAQAVAYPYLRYRGRLPSDLLDEARRLMEHGGAGEIMGELATEPICHECKNRRIVLADLDPNREYRLCYTCDGDPGPDLTDEQLIEQLRLEKTLLSDKPQSWSASLRLTRAKPLRDVDPDELAPWAGVDIQR